MDEMGFLVSQNLHHESITNIFYAPMSFFDTTVSLLYGEETEDCSGTNVLADGKDLERIWERC